jgi:VWFA-related protein
MKFLAAAFLLLTLQGEHNETDIVIHRASAYVDVYMKQLGTIIGEEQYNQEAQWTDARSRSHRERRLISDFLTVPVGKEWIGIRHVRKVDDIALDPLYRGVWREAFDESTSQGRQQLQEAFMYESTRYNIGDFSRSTNLPTFPLELLDEDNLPVYTFSKAGEERVNGVQAWKVKFSERVGSSLIMATSIGLPERWSLSGVFWIEPTTGRVFRAQVDFRNPIRPGREVRMDVRFRHDSVVNILVPGAMDESYSDKASRHQVEAHADYLNFRRFNSDVRFGDSLGAVTEDEPELRRESEDTYAVKVDVRVVNVEAWVTGSSGGAVTDLKSGDFQIFENDVLQKITNFSPVSTPYDVLLLFDQSGSTRSDWKTMQRAAEGFISSARPQDRVGIAIFNSSFRMLTRWNNSREQLRKTVEELTKPRGVAGTAFYRAVEMSLGAEMLPVAGRRRALLVLTDGRDNDLMRYMQRQGRIPTMGQEREFQQMVRLARQERVPIYVVNISNSGNEVAELRRYYSDEAAARYLDGVEARLEHLAESSGGRVVFPKKFEDIIPLYAQISRELGSAYSIGYESNVPASFQGFREIKVRTSDPRLHVVQSRAGYVAP